MSGGQFILKFFGQSTFWGLILGVGLGVVWGAVDGSVDASFETGSMKVVAFIVALIASVLIYIVIGIVLGAINGIILSFLTIIFSAHKISYVKYRTTIMTTSVVITFSGMIVLLSPMGILHLQGNPELLVLVEIFAATFIAAYVTYRLSKWYLRYAIVLQ